MDAVAEDIANSTVDSTAEYTVVYSKTAGVGVQNTVMGVEGTGVVIEAP